MSKKGLTELQCKNAKPGNKKYRLADTGGLYMEKRLDAHLSPEERKKIREDADAYQAEL
jgi:hypothetical protein